MIDKSLKNLDESFPKDFNKDQKAKAKTLFLKNLSKKMHHFYSGKIQTIPKAGVFSFNWFNLWYTPGVSSVSTTIRENNDESFNLSNRGNLVAVVSDSTRVLGDGDCTPPGGLGVMEGKAFLMKYLSGVDAVALCMNSKNDQGEPQAQKIIDFVKMAEPSFGAVNLEDISQPNCYEVLDRLRKECNIPVWHDDAQGTACVTLAGIINALKLADKNIEDVKITLLGAGAANTTVARLLEKHGADLSRMVLFDSKGSLNVDRDDIKSDSRFYRKWELCQKTNHKKITTIEKAFEGADIIIGLSQPGPDVIKPEWIRSMAKKAIVFACANPVPEIYPHTAKEAGAFIVATGRGDFPNQVNNSIGFPGILKGALMVRAKGISDEMAIAASKAIANFAEKRGIDPDNIVPTMDETDLFPFEAAEVAMQAIKEGNARINLSFDQVYQQTEKDIQMTRDLCQLMMNEKMIQEPPQELIEKALQETLSEFK